MIARSVLQRHILLVEVRGYSMFPTLRPGELVVAKRATKVTRALRSGDLVVVEAPKQVRETSPRTRLLVKRIATVQEEGIGVVGEMPGSCDSSTFGLLPLSTVRGVVTYRLQPWEKLS